MEIEKASEMGFCFGVRRAISLAEKAAKERGRLYTLGPLVHNKQVVDTLARKGIIAAASLEEVTGDIVAIPSHGASPDIIKQIKGRGMEAIDATCPYVRKVQLAARKLSKEGFYVLVFGDISHAEVKSVLGWAGEKANATLDAAGLEGLPEQIGIVCQTTQNQPRFAAFIASIISSGIIKYSELRIVDTICEATRRRQSAALDLVKKTDVILVVGARDSANTRRLAEICGAAGAATYHVETEADIESSWLRGKRRIGVTAGASTPDDIIDRVLTKLREIDKQNKK